MNIDKPKRKGRRPLPAGQKKQQISVYLTPDVVERLRAVDDNVSAAIERLTRTYAGQGWG